MLHGSPDGPTSLCPIPPSDTGRLTSLSIGKSGDNLIDFAHTWVSASGSASGIDFRRPPSLPEAYRLVVELMLGGVRLHRLVAYRHHVSLNRLTMARIGFEFELNQSRMLRRLN
jgi:hypothetical protein